MSESKLNRDLFKNQVRSFRIMSATQAVLFGLYGIGMYLLDSGTTFLAIIGFDVFVSIAVLFFIQNGHTKSTINKAYYFVMVVHWLTIQAGTIVTGGIGGDFVYVMLVQSIAAFVNSKREGLFWGAMNIICFTLYLILFQWSDFRFINDIPSHSHQWFRYFTFWYIFLNCIGMALLYTRSTYKAFKDKKTIHLQQVEIEKQNDVLQQKNNEILSGITYASKIQNAMLPMQDTITQCFSQHFVIYQPKGIVSGDFYWVGEANKKKIIAAVDCTGHGVPGALMSMLGNSILNQTILEKKISKADEILESLRELLIFTLGNRDKPDEQRDGMDMALLAFDEDFSRVEFAGAKNPVYHIRKDEITVINGETHPVGVGYGKDLKPFCSHSIPLLPGDQLYIFSDGYTDQFGGPLDRKFGHLRLQETLLNIASLSMEEQKNILEETLLEWQGNHPRIDDVCLIGIRIV